MPIAAIVPAIGTGRKRGMGYRPFYGGPGWQNVLSEDNVQGCPKTFAFLAVVSNVFLL